MEAQPLVSVVCLCYNHAAFVEEAIRSALAQSYKHTELIVVDDASTDGSAAIIRELARHLDFKAFFHKTNQGNCRAFNEAFNASKGQYIIDLAADDVLFPERVETGVEMLERLGETYGVHFCDVLLTDENDKTTGTHYRGDEQGKLREKVPEGDVYREVLERYFISTPSMMMRREVFEALGGYDESLTFEDFDFWVRSARDFKYAFTDAVLVKKRVLSSSLSTQQFRHKNPHLLSTAVVCEKAFYLNKNKAENQALAKRVKYELKWALITENAEAVRMFIRLLEKLETAWVYRAFASLMVKYKVPVFWIYKLFSGKA